MWLFAETGTRVRISSRRPRLQKIPQLSSPTNVLIQHVQLSHASLIQFHRDRPSYHWTQTPLKQKRKIFQRMHSVRTIDIAQNILNNTTQCTLTYWLVHAYVLALSGGSRPHSPSLHDLAACTAHVVTSYPIRRRNDHRNQTLSYCHLATRRISANSKT